MSAATLPALSLSRTVKRARRPSAAKPRSRQRPRTVVSMLPPQSTTTTLGGGGGGGGGAKRIKGSLKMCRGLNNLKGITRYN